MRRIFSMLVDSARIRFRAFIDGLNTFFQDVRYKTYYSKQFLNEFMAIYHNRECVDFILFHINALCDIPFPACMFTSFSSTYFRLQLIFKLVCLVLQTGSVFANF